MGLDMYLSAKKYYSGGEWHPEENRKQFQELLDKSGIAQYVATTFQAFSWKFLLAIGAKQTLFTNGS